MIDYESLLFDPAYEVFGVDAVLTLADSAGTTAPVTVIDKTGGVSLGPNIEVGTILPGAVVRVSELAAYGITAAALDEATLIFNGGVWRIASHHPKPVPSGESFGEIVLMLEQVNG